MQVLCAVIAIVVLVGLAMVTRIVKHHEDGVLFQLGRIIGDSLLGFRIIVPAIADASAARRVTALRTGR